MAAIIRASQSDTRPYAKIKIGNIELIGLLDSGATHSVLGNGAEAALKQFESQIKPFRTSVVTADGRKHQNNGLIELPVEFQNQTGKIKFTICPSLEKPAYLGVDFWRVFGLAPDIVGVADLQDGEANVDDLNELVIYEQHELTDEQRKQLDEATAKLRTYEKDGLGRTHVDKHSIKLKEGSEPVKERYYPVSPAVQKLIYDEVDEMLRLKVIEESTSPWSNRSTLVRKGDKSRLCLDARTINDKTIKDAYPLPNIEGIFSRIDDAVFISSIDLKHAFWQIELDEESREYTAFTVPGRPLYQYVVMPFGLCNAAQRLCRVMDKIIPEELKNHVFVYLDDLLVIAKDFESHIKLLSRVADCLSQANLTVGMAKSRFCFKELPYLGFIIGGGCLKTDPRKVEAILQMPAPRTQKEVRRVLGMAGWYRRFIRDFSTIAAPLTDMLKKRDKFVMTPAAYEAFEKLKTALTTAPVLVHPNFNKPFFIQCDASHVGVGAVLYQKSDDDQDQPIAFLSQKLNSAQQNYSVTEKECLAAVLAVKKFRAYVELMEFTIITDHASLKWLLSMKDLNGRLARWALQLQSFKFHIEHRKGADNVVADTLSRAICSLEQVGESDTANDFSTPEYLALIEKIRVNQCSYPDVKIVDGKIYKRNAFEQIGNEFSWKLWVPPSMTARILSDAHDPPEAAHRGFHKTLERIRELYYWPRMVADTREYVRQCEICKQCKPCNTITRPMMGNETITCRSFQKLYADFLGPYPRSKRNNTQLLVIVDHFSRFPFLKPMPKATAERVVKYMKEEIFCVYGIPESIHTDNGKQFVSKEFQALLQKYGIRHIRTAIHAPQSNASERLNQSILAAIRSYIKEDHTEWDKNLPEITTALRSSMHESIGTTPYLAVFGHRRFGHGNEYKLARELEVLEDGEFNVLDAAARRCILNEEVKKHLHEAHDKGKKQYDKRAREITYRPGQEVYRRNFIQSNFSKNLNAKFCNKYIKCRIVKPIGNSLYEVENLQGKHIGVIHAKDLKQ